MDVEGEAASAGVEVIQKDLTQITNEGGYGTQHF